MAWCVQRLLIPALPVSLLGRTICCQGITSAPQACKLEGSMVEAAALWGAGIHYLTYDFLWELAIHR